MSTQQQVGRTAGCTKKSFPTSAAAETFASELQRKYPTQARQSVYACENCPGWHLSAMDPVAHGMAASRVNISSSANSTRAPHLHKDLQHIQSKIKELYTARLATAGKTGIIAHVCRALEITDTYQQQTVRRFLIYAGLHTPNPRMTAAQTGRAKPDSSIESIESKKQELERQLRDLQAKKQALIEMKALKISDMVNSEKQPVVVVKKEGMSLVLTHEDAFLLVEKLEAHLAALPTH
jgi:PHD/YefM family antitoxin component YafN of YafNO toxin-antitoxin module